MEGEVHTSSTSYDGRVSQLLPVEPLRIELTSKVPVFISVQRRLRFKAALLSYCQPLRRLVSEVHHTKEPIFEGALESPK